MFSRTTNKELLLNRTILLLERTKLIFSKSCEEEEVIDSKPYLRMFVATTKIAWRFWLFIEDLNQSFFMVNLGVSLGVEMCKVKLIMLILR